MLSQQELADRAGVSLFTIQRIERGEGSVRPKTGRAVARALGVQVEDLYPKAQAPLWSEEQAEERRIGYAALTAWAEYLELMLERWGELEWELRSLPARSEPNEALALMDLQHTLARVEEFFRNVWGVARTADRKLFKELDIHSRRLEAPEREAVRLIRARGNRLDAISQHFERYLELLKESLKERLVQRFMEGLEEFLESVRVEEESAEEGR